MKPNIASPPFSPRRMAVKRSFSPSNEGSTIGGLFLGAFWGGHIVGYFLRGSQYMYIASLLVVVFVSTIRVCLRRHFLLHNGSRCGIGVAMACWLLGATLGTFANLGTHLVAITYCAVFLGGAGIYVALDGVKLASRELELGIAGIIVGSMVPLLGGLRAFDQSWGLNDLPTILNAYKNTLRMLPYEDATYGNRVNTAMFIVIIAPTLLWVCLDRGRGWFIRILCAASLAPISLSLIILQVRAAFITLAFSIAVIFAFRLRTKRFLVFIAVCGVGLACLLRYASETTTIIADRLEPVVTLDATQDTSVLFRTEAMKEGLTIGMQHPFLGIGPGAGLTVHSQTSSHQLFIQEFMEAGLIGAVGSFLLTCSVLWFLLRTLLKGPDCGINSLRFTLIIGPASFLFFGVLANDTFNMEFTDTWTALVVSMLALTPKFPKA